jgi:hypothetical protein
MISAAFCDELVKISMDPETKKRLKNEAKLIGASGAVAAGVHGAAELGRYALEKKYGPAIRKRIATKAIRGGAPGVAAIGTYLASKAIQHNRERARKQLAEGK